MINIMLMQYVRQKPESLASTIFYCTPRSISPLSFSLSLSVICTTHQSCHKHDHVNLTSSTEVLSHLSWHCQNACNHLLQSMGNKRSHTHTHTFKMITDQYCQLFLAITYHHQSPLTITHPHEPFTITNIY